MKGSAHLNPRIEFSFGFVTSSPVLRSVSELLSFCQIVEEPESPRRIRPPCRSAVAVFRAHRKNQKERKYFIKWKFIFISFVVWRSNEYHCKWHKSSFRAT